MCSGWPTKLGPNYQLLYSKIAWRNRLICVPDRGSKITCYVATRYPFCAVSTSSLHYIFPTVLERLQSAVYFSLLKTRILEYGFFSPNCSWTYRAQYCFFMRRSRWYFITWIVWNGGWGLIRGDNFNTIVIYLLEEPSRYEQKYVHTS